MPDRSLGRGRPGDDKALADFQEEAELVLPFHDRAERLFVVAEAP